MEPFFSLNQKLSFSTTFYGSEVDLESLRLGTLPLDHLPIEKSPPAIVGDLIPFV